MVLRPCSANAACECGYSVNQTSDATHAVYTDLMENDFLHTAGDNLTEFGWAPQEYNVSAEAARGPFGKEFLVGNSILNPLKDPSAWSGEGEDSGDAGLQLWVRGDHSHGFVNGAELASVRHDALYGSFRVGMKLSPQNGTCGAFFWVCIRTSPSRPRLSTVANIHSSTTIRKKSTWNSSPNNSTLQAA